MSTVHTRYVTWLSRGRRGHGSAALDLVTPLSTQVDNPGVYQAWASSNISWEDSNGQDQTAQFAFWSVTGAPGGPGVSFSPSLSIEVGGGDVQATAWYLPGGGGSGDRGTFVDAFDVAQGTFVDDDFVTISPDAELTNAANETGFVPSAAAETVSAYDTIHAVPFLDWRVMVQAPAGSDSVNTTHLHTGASSTGVAFAFYQSTGGGGGMKLPNPGRYQKGTWVSWGVMVDGGGPTGNGPVGPWDPLVRSLATALAMAEAAKLSDPELQRAGLDLAAKQLEMTATKMAEAMRKGFSSPVRVTGVPAQNKR